MQTMKKSLIKEVYGKDNPRICEQVTEIRRRVARKYKSEWRNNRDDR